MTRKEKHNTFFGAAAALTGGLAVLGLLWMGSTAAYEAREKLITFVASMPIGNLIFFFGFASFLIVIIVSKLTHL